MKNVLVILALAIVVLVAVIATRPATFHVERSATIAAPPESVFARVDDLHRFGDWSPWDKRDPNMSRTYEGPASGVGASYHWTGNKDVGEGRMTIVESVPAQKVGMRIEFIKPFASTDSAGFAFAPAPGGTRVTWTMDGPNNFMSKAMSLFGSMDKMIGPDFEKGLATLKSRSEASGANPAGAGAPADSTHS